MIDLQVFIIKTLPDEYIKKTIDSLNSEAAKRIILSSLTVIDELDTREETLNKIFLERDASKDVFIIADDIVFMEGWVEALENNYFNGDIIGFSMIDGKSGNLQDFGYDFISTDNGLSYKGMHKHSAPDNLVLPEFRECDSVTGCAMIIKQNVCNKINRFPLEGANRWGELIYCNLAKNKGFKTIVLKAHLLHYAISTKQKDSTKKSSLSWLIERDQWSNVVDMFFNKVVPKFVYKSSIKECLGHYINESEKLLIYGCGVNADAILANISHSNWDICSGLPEEQGQTFAGKKILDINKINFSFYNDFLITPVGYDKEITIFFPNAIKIKGITLTHKRDKMELGLRSINRT